VAIGIIGVVLLAIGVIGFVVSGAVAGDYEAEEKLLDAKGVEAEQPTAELNAATDRVKAALDAFRDSVDAGVSAHNRFTQATDPRDCSLLPNNLLCQGPTAEEIQNSVFPAADAYAAAVDAEQNALAQLGQALAALKAARQ
jgi:hypothetical protein